MIYSERSVRSAVYVDSENNSTTLRRIPFMDRSSYNEEWLQELLASHPELLHTTQFGFDFSTMVCIGREVKVSSNGVTGYIDNLYVTPSGKIVVVETKLFRNQEARREVVAQIIDYAKEMQSWDCEHLDKICEDFTQHRLGQPYQLFDLMLNNGLTARDEAWFTDKINESLSNADFLLLIVGDGIRSSVEKLADFITEHSLMRFNLALVEIEIYEHGSGCIVIPNYITKTSIIQRQVFYTGVSSVEYSKPEPPKAKSPLLSKKDFMSAFATNGGIPLESVESFVSDLESVSGVFVTVHPSAIRFRISISDKESAPVMCFGRSGGMGKPVADIWVCPESLLSKLKDAGIPTGCSESFFSFYKQFVDISRCKNMPFDYSGGFYYADVDKVMAHKDDFVSAFEELISSIKSFV